MTTQASKKVWVLKLNGNSVTQSYVRCGTSPTLSFGGGEPYTLSAKLCMNGSSGTIMGKLLSTAWDGSGTPQGYCVLPYPSTEEGIRAYRSSSPYDCDVRDPNIYNRWIHLVVTFQNGTYTIYLDDKQIGTQSGFQDITPAPANAEFLIGTCYRGAVGTIGNSPQNWLYESVAVISTHVEAKHISSLATSDHDFPIVALWDFTTQTAKDLTGNGNDGTLMGTAEFVQVDPPWEK